MDREITTFCKYLKRNYVNHPDYVLSAGSCGQIYPDNNSGQAVLSSGETSNLKAGQHAPSASWRRAGR